MDNAFGGEWTKQKRKILTKYLLAYRKIFDRNEKARYLTTTYVDAFAGSGHWTPKQPEEGAQGALPFLDEESEKLFSGTPIEALKLESPFDKYLFIEKDEAAAQSLRERCAQVCPEQNANEKEKNPSRVEVKHGDANKVLRKFCKSMGKMDRAVVFLDPYGLSVRWETIKLLAETEKVDLWYWFNIGAVNRLLERRGPPDGALAGKLTEIFGTDEWQNAFYTDELPDLFGHASHPKAVGFSQIATFLLNRLKSAFGEEGVAPSASIFVNSKNTPLFLFCFAASNKTGAATAIKIANDLLTKYGKRVPA